MARPRVFVSSTYYDLKHVRSSMDNFVESLGFDSVLSEKGDIAYAPEIPLDESCFREATGADLFVLIIGGRYGAPVTKDGVDKAEVESGFYDRYESITKKEFESAVERDVPCYILIESSVYAEYWTYLQNKKNEGVVYAHVESVNIFLLIEEIFGRRRNNPVHTFDRFSDIEHWLREQWAGLFRDQLRRRSEIKQLADLSSQVDHLRAINSTLQRYLEAVVEKVSPSESKELIAAERKRLVEVEIESKLARNQFYRNVLAPHLSVDNFYLALKCAGSSYASFVEEVQTRIVSKDREDIIDTMQYYGDKPFAIRSLNEARMLVENEPFEVPD